MSRNARACVFGITLAAAALVVAAVGGCTGTPLEPAMPAGVNLAGTWTLDAQASQNPQGMIDEIERNLQKRMRRRGPPMGPLDDLDDAIDDEPESTGSTGRGAGRVAVNQRLVGATRSRAARRR